MKYKKKQVDFISVLADVADAVAGYFDEHRLLDQIINTTMETLNAEVCSIFLEDKETEPGVLKCVAGSGFAKKIVKKAKYKIGEGFTGMIAKEGREYNIKNKEELSNLEVDGEKIWKGKFDNQQWKSGNSEFRNLIALPLKIKGQTLGVIKAENKIQRYGDFFSEQDLINFKTIASVIALAIENARLHRRAEEQSKRIPEIFADVASAVVGHFDMQTLLDQIVNITMKTLNAEVSSIFLEDKENDPGILTCVACSGYKNNIVGLKYKIGEGLTGTIAYEEGYNSKSKEEHRNLKYKGKKVWLGKYDQTQWLDNEFRNGISLPLKIKDQTLGVIKAENKNSKFGDFFSDDDLTIFRTIANVVAVTIENAKLHQQIEDQLKIIAAKAAHRINNQITRYDGIELDFNYEIISEKFNKKNLQELLDSLKLTTKNLKRMVNEFKEYGKPIKLSKEVTNINQLILNEIKSFQKLKGIDIKVEIDNQIPNLYIDIARFSESIRELIKNAQTAITNTNNSGNIIISTHLIKHTVNSRPIKVLITIKDDGPGIPASFPLFSPFSTTNAQSTGLGLATVKEIVNTHNGTIEYNRQKHGAMFKILMPIEG